MQQLSQELEQDEARTFRHQVGSPLANSPPGKDILNPIIFLIHILLYHFRKVFSVI